EAYLPFSSGARICPGAGFALTEAVLILALLIRRFRFFPVDSSLPVPVAHLTLRSKYGVHLGAEVREL
ncbi:MAG: cytochrome P450, partial [Paracoccaceae bacterium]|nr:cytochrome P450 [Paracoccaceae bacterium]